MLIIPKNSSNRALRISVGQPVPKMWHGSGPSAQCLLPSGMHVIVLRDTLFSAEQTAAVSEGLWRIGMARGGTHATRIHLRWHRTTRSTSKVVYAADLAFSVSSALHDGLDPRPYMEGDLVFVVAHVDRNETVRAASSTMLGASELAFLRRDMSRQLRARAVWSPEAQAQAYDQALARQGTMIDREACGFWKDERFGWSRPYNWLR